jgi:hypothetical protein
MMKLQLGEKEYQIKFGYEATLKSRILSRMANASVSAEEDGKNLEKVEDLLLLLPDVILVGLQKFHKDEFGYDYDTKEGRDERLNKVFCLLDDYFDTDDADVMSLYSELQEEMLQNGFLSKMFREEVQKAEKTAKLKEK